MTIAAVIAAIVSASMSPNAANNDPATQLSAVFFNLCGGTVAGVESPMNVADFKFTTLDPKLFRKLRPTEKGPYWDVESTSSKARGLVHIWSNGNCSLEVVESDERATRLAFTSAVEGFAVLLGADVKRAPDKIEQKDGQPMTSSEWVLAIGKRRLLVGLTTYPEAKYMTQHIMLLRDGS